MQVSQRIPAMANNFRPRIQIPRGTAFPILEVGHSKAVNKWEGLLSSLVESNCHVGIPVQQALSYMTRYCANSTCQISLVARPFTGRVTCSGERENLKTTLHILERYVTTVHLIGRVSVRLRLQEQCLICTQCLLKELTLLIS